MQRLAGTDAMFLAMESPGAHQHVGGVTIIDPAEGVDFSIERLRNTVMDRLQLVPKFMCKVREVPFNLDLPILVPDPDFDIDRHVRRIAVPSPGGKKELGELVGQLMSYQLDRRLPLWEMWIIEGVHEGKRLAVFMKYHHALMDGLTGASLADQLFDLEPLPASAGSAAKTAAPVGHEGPSSTRQVSDVELLARAVLPTLKTPLRMVRYGVRALERGVTMGVAKSRSRGLPGVVAPATPFNGMVRHRRHLSFASVSLDDVKRLRKGLDAKVNDLVLAIVAGAVRAYLTELDQLPDSPLTTMIAVSTRVADDPSHESGNSIASVPVLLPTHLADPLERVRAVQESTSAAKEMLNAVRARTIQSLGEVAPPLLLNLASRAMYASNVGAVFPTVVSMLVSNVPGPPIPLYMCGAKVTGIYASSVLMFNMGLNITLMSYQDRMDFGLTVDPDLVANPWRLADALPAALAELLTAAGLGEPSEVDDPFTD